MSYSFSVRAVANAAVLALVTQKFDEVLAHQPGHAADRA